MSGEGIFVWDLKKTQDGCSFSKLNPGERLGEITEMGKTSISRFSQRLSSDIMKYFESLASGTVCLLIYL